MSLAIHAYFGWLDWFANSAPAYALRPSPERRKPCLPMYAVSANVISFGASARGAIFRCRRTLCNAAFLVFRHNYVSVAAMRTR